MKETKAISVARPSEPRLAVAWVLDVWASGCHHQANLGSGDPEWRGIFSEPRPIEPLGPTVPVCDRSDELYDGTRGKYERHPRSDVRVLYCTDLVERGIRAVGAPPVFTCYLLHKYPRTGCYAPQYRGTVWEEEPARAFVERGSRLGMEGFDGTSKQLRRFEKWLRRRERDLKDEIRGILKKVAQDGTNPVPVASNC